MEPERKLSDLLNNQKFSDVSITYSKSSKWHCHRAILASGSRYFLDLFNHFPVGELDEVTIPEPLITTGDTRDQIEKVLKYIYNN